MSDTTIEANDRGSRRVLTVRVETTEEFFDRGARAIEAVERGDSPDDAGPSLSLHGYEELQRVLSAKNVELLEAIREHDPGSIRELARLVGRDVSRVHGNLTELEALGLVEFEAGHGRAKRPVVWFDELDIRVPLTS